MEANTKEHNANIETHKKPQNRQKLSKNRIA